MSKQKTHYVNYTPELGLVLPESAFPLPIPCSLDTVKVPMWWDDFISFCEEVCNGAGGEKPIPYIPTKLKKCPKNPILMAVTADITISLDFWRNWSSIPKEKDTPEYFPRGLASLIESGRQDFVSVVNIGKTKNWPLYIAQEYKTAYWRCAGIAAAQNLGHWPSQEQRNLFTVENVTQALKGTHGFTGPVNYSHIRNLLYAAAQRRIQEEKTVNE